MRVSFCEAVLRVTERTAENMGPVLLAEVQLHPIATAESAASFWTQRVGVPVKVEGDSFRANIGRKDILEFVVSDVPVMVAVQPDKNCAFERYLLYEHIKVLKCHPIIGVRSLQHRFEHCELIPRNHPPSGRVRNTEQYTELCAPDFGEVILGRNGTDEAFRVQEPVDFHTTSGEYSILGSLEAVSGTCD